MKAEKDPEMFEREDTAEVPRNGEGWEDWDDLDEASDEAPGLEMLGPIDPNELREQRFLLSLFGYDRGEVRSFLSFLADRLEAGDLTASASSYKDEDDATHTFRAVGDEVARILEATTEAARQLRVKLVSEAQEARDEAAELLQRATAGAEQESRALVEGAEARAREVIEEAELRASAIIENAEKEAQEIRSAEEEARAKLVRLEQMVSNLRKNLSRD